MTQSYQDQEVEAEVVVVAAQEIGDVDGRASPVHDQSHHYLDDGKQGIGHDPVEAETEVLQDTSLEENLEVHDEVATRGDLLLPTKLHPHRHLY